jgi:nucleoid-associated protein EbfC
MSDLPAIGGPGDADDDPMSSLGFDMGGLLEQAMDMQRQMLETQARLAATEVEGQAGGGVVRIVLTGDFDVRAVHLAADVVDPDDVDMLADLIQAAFRDAVARVADLHATAATAGTGMPDVGQLLEGLGGLGLTGGGVAAGDPGDDAEDDEG